MTRNIRVVAPMVYGLVVAVVAITGGPTSLVAIIGAVLLGIMYVLLSAGGRRESSARR